MTVFASNGGANGLWRIGEPPNLPRIGVAAGRDPARGKTAVSRQRLSQQQLKQLSHLSGIVRQRLINSFNALKNHDSSAAILLACRLLIVSSRHANRSDVLAAN
jgi:hypothetical protein